MLVTSWPKKTKQNIFTHVKDFPRPLHINKVMFLRHTASPGLFILIGLDAIERPFSTGCAVQEAACLLHSVSGDESVKMAKLLLILGVGQQLSAL